jgi:hypothetical protein
MNQRNESLSTADFVAAAGRHDGGVVEESQRANPDHAPEIATGGAAAAREPRSEPLFSEQDTHDLRSSWDHIQTGFVDEPRKAVEEADALVAQVIKRLAEVFATERSRMEGDWSRGQDVSTEDLRQALRRYRSFFDRLLSV